jgi:hypothetical protein
MPTPPFSQHRRDWLEEVSGLFSKKGARKDKAIIASTVNVKVSDSKELLDDGASTRSSTKSQTVVDGAGRI